MPSRLLFHSGPGTSGIALLVAAIAEIGGCYCFWAWLRLGASPFWCIPGILALTVFAIALTFIDLAYAGRAFAAYGGVYIVTSLVWMRVVEGGSPDRWDMAGALVCLGGAAIILFAPRPV